MVPLNRAVVLTRLPNFTFAAEFHIITSKQRLIRQLYCLKIQLLYTHQVAGSAPPSLTMHPALLRLCQQTLLALQPSIKEH